jgi:hypothetical protein
VVAGRRAENGFFTKVQPEQKMMAMSRVPATTATAMLCMNR